MLKRSVITDEVSQSIPVVLDFAKQFSLDALELRSVEDRGPFDYDDALVDRLAEAFGAAGLPVCALSLPLFKCDAEDLQTQATHLAALKAAIAHAKRLGCRLLRGFCFWRPQDGSLPMEAITRAYAQAIPLVAEADMRIVIESDPSVNGHTAHALATILAAIDSPYVRALWDGGNLLFAENGEAPVDAYALLKPWISHVHIKDARREAGGETVAVCVGTGQAQIAEQLALLRRDGYEDFLSLETHYRLTGVIDEGLMRLPGGNAFSEGALEASVESMTALDRLIREAYQA